MIGKQGKMLSRELFRKFFSCPQCGRAITGEMEIYFTCPQCGKALCKESKLEDFNDAYCGNCGFEIASAKKLALAETERLG